MPKPNPWIVWGQQWHIPDYQAYYYPRRGPAYQHDSLVFEPVLPGAPASPYTLHGSVKYEPYLGSGNRVVGGFRIEGTGTVIDKPDGGQLFDSQFQIVEGSGTDEFTGVSGSGRLKVEIGE
ncbi:MAG: hypothetical protein L6R38_008501 [Xanthoria sp. 2 TBL-2021]|nr:MAG: hypothetical protein L6R38_008501 [Xanthoria sp. 2 TBL-2021]